MIAIGDRVIVSGKSGTLATAPVSLPDGFCCVKFDHVPNATQSYMGTMVALVDVRPLVIKLVQLALPLVWSEAA